MTRAQWSQQGSLHARLTTRCLKHACFWQYWAGGHQWFSVHGGLAVSTGMHIAHIHMNDQTTDGAVLQIWLKGTTFLQTCMQNKAKFAYATLQLAASSMPAQSSHPHLCRAAGFQTDAQNAVRTAILFNLQGNPAESSEPTLLQLSCNTYSATASHLYLKSVAHQIIMLLTNRHQQVKR